MEETESLDDHVNTLMTQLKGQDLYYAINGSQFRPVPDTPIGAIFLSAKLNEIVYLNTPVAYFPIPILANTEFGDVLIKNNYTLAPSSSEFGLQLATQPAAWILASAIYNLLLTFNWTLVGLMYSNDSYGSAGQSVFIDLSGFTDVVAIQCDQIFMNSTCFRIFFLRKEFQEDKSHRSLDVLTGSFTSGAKNSQ